MPRILIITGEASGDLHGANLARALKQADASLSVVGIGIFTSMTPGRSRERYSPSTAVSNGRHSHVRPAAEPPGDSG